MYRKSLGAALVVVVVGVVAGGIAYAAVGGGGVIQACYKANGDLHVVGTDPTVHGGKCNKDETPLEWNQAGIPGAPGEDGENGAPGTNGVSGYEIVERANGPFGPSAHGGVDAFCPQGKVPVGGGYSLPQGALTAQVLTVVASYPFEFAAGPLAGEKGWRVMINTAGGPDANIVVYAICVNAA